MDTGKLFLQSNPQSPDGVLIQVDPVTAGWEYIGLTVHSLTAGASLPLTTAESEIVVVLLSGRCEIGHGHHQYKLGPRRNVFDGAPWGLYVPIESEAELAALTDCEIAVCSSQATDSFPARLIRPEDVDIEIRGAGNAARQINHIIKPDFPAHRLLVVEVITPSGNWSSFPPHKHDVSDMPRESDLEEIYYYRVSPHGGFGLQRLYVADGSVDAAWVIKDGDLLLVPEGYHAFVVAQGYTGYYLNVLAGNETVRTMQPADDPAHHWVRETWTEEMTSGMASWRDIEDRVNAGAGRRTDG
jgi:5-deoxy-glucuronate isomerase